MEEKILALLKERPEKGLEKLMDTYAGLVYTIVYNKLYLICSKEDIEECVSSVLYEAYENRNSIDLSKGTLKSFLAVIAKYRAIDVFRQKEKLVGKVVSLEAYIDEGGTEARLSNGTYLNMDHEAKDLLIESIKLLGEPDNEIFIRKYYLGQNTKTISKMIGIKENTIDKKVSRGLVKLKKLIEGGTGIQEGTGI